MRELFAVWTRTRQIVLIAVTAAIFAGTLIPFKPIQIVPGLTELRPASVIPVLFGILFGPAAAWGSAIGNLIADFFGMLTPASAFGFVGNFLYSYVAFRVWRVLVRGEITMNARQIGIFALCAVLASLVCALVVGLGVQLLGMAPFHVLFFIVFINNSVMAGVLGPILMKLLYRRIDAMGLVYDGGR
ncbi:MAG TPA: QueT transporter family protein [Spirochaetota bacterium]|nr:QueT transporter family protein [Spirochaetota bacterium]HPI23234.1 QueT transporter family protein [Spirochaetota bacterium]HPU89272.1 QueT transporter family protein [Spirochaetota bacterium]